MKIDIRSAAAVAVLAIAAAGCSFMVDPKKSDPLNTAEGHCNSMLDALEKRILTCYQEDQASLDSYLKQAQSGCRNLGDAVSAGRVGYDRSIAEQCLARYAQLACNVSDWPTLQFCATATPGKVNVGGACHSQTYAVQDECAGDAFCDSSATCPGTCVTRGGPYQPCPTAPVFTSGAQPCVDGYYCETTIVPPYPASTCLPVPATPGAPCGYFTNYQCGGGLGCGWTGSGYFCAAPAPHLGDCSATGYECALASDYCRWQPTGPYLCTTRPTTLQPIGGDCGNNNDADCQAGLVCDYNNNYVCAALLPPGSPCTNNNSHLCGNNARCSMGPLATVGSCVVPKKLGQSCAVGFEECTSGLYCNGPGPGAPGTCRSALSDRGGTCGYQVAVFDPTYGYNVTREYVRCIASTFCSLTSSTDFPGICTGFGTVGTSCGYPNYGACGEPWTGLTCDGATSTCVANSCRVAFGFSGGD